MIQIVGHAATLLDFEISRYAGIAYEEVSYLGAGINHLSWILRFEHNGRDAYPLLR